MRGHSDSRLAGAVRTVARVEERWTIGASTQRRAFGLAGFVAAGRVWAGDAPFGVNSRVKAGVGVGTAMLLLWSRSASIGVPAAIRP